MSSENGSKYAFGQDNVCRNKRTLSKRTPPEFMPPEQTAVKLFYGLTTQSKLFQKLFSYKQHSTGANFYSRCTNVYPVVDLKLNRMIGQKILALSSTRRMNLRN